jgi:hypothetical protein
MLKSPVLKGYSLENIFFILNVFKISSFSSRIFEYTMTFRGEFLLSHKTINELCYVDTIR